MANVTNAAVVRRSTTTAPSAAPTVQWDQLDRALMKVATHRKNRVLKSSSRVFTRFYTPTLYIVAHALELGRLTISDNLPRRYTHTLTDGQRFCKLFSNDDKAFVSSVLISIFGH